MKKQLSLLAALFVIGMMLPATVQAQRYEDVVHLKNGSVIRGIIVEQVPNESLKIETRDGNIFVYQMDEVEKMTKETTTSRSPRAGRSTVNRVTREQKFKEFNKPQGYLGIVEVGGGLGLGNYAAQRASVSVINGYRFFPQFAVGIGVGLEAFFYTWHNHNNGDTFTGSEGSIPIFLHLRSDFIDGKVTPYVAVNTGYNISWSGGYIDSKMIDPSFGVSFNAGRKNHIMIGVGYAMNWIKSHSGYGYHTQSGMTGGIKLKVGLSF
jgi:hypothetical protein